MPAPSAHMQTLCIHTKAAAPGTTSVFLSPSPTGWSEAVLQAPCPGSAAPPAPRGASHPPELSSLTPPAMHASYHALVTCMLWSVWRPRLYFDVTSLT